MIQGELLEKYMRLFMTIEGSCVFHTDMIELRKQKKSRVDFWQFRGVHSQSYCANSKLQTDFFFFFTCEKE